MATIKQIGPDATEIKIDGLNAVLFYKNEPVAAVFSGGGFRTKGPVDGIGKNHTFQWLLNEWKITGPSFRPQSFFDNILKIYMNPAALDTPGKGVK